MSDPQKRLPIESLIAAAKTGVRSPLYEYLWGEHDRLVKEFAGPVNWIAVAAEFRKSGIKAGRGKDVTEQSARQTWYRVRKDKTPPKRKRLKEHWKA